MPLNMDVFGTLIGKLKALTIVIGLIDLVVTAATYWTFSKEEYYLAMVIICFIISLLWFVVLLLGFVSENALLTKIDFVYHALAGLLLVIGMICWFVNVVDLRRGTKSGRYVFRVFAGILGLANGPLYILIAVLLFQKSGFIG